VNRVPAQAVTQGTGVVLEAQWLRQLCLDAGADDAGFVEIGRPALAEQRDDILAGFPQTQTLVSLVGRLHREASRTPVASVAYVENQIVVGKLDRAAHEIAMALEGRGVRALAGGASAFPLDADRHPEKGWLVSHKPVAVAAGMGGTGLHRCVIHPRFGSFVVLGTVLVAARLDRYDAPLEKNPCCGCQLCVEVCPVGAIGADGYFNFSACLTYNYRELMGGFLDWVANLTDSRDFRAYRRKFSDTETVAMWQSLAFGANFKSACCCAVCPAGAEVIGPFQEDREAFVRQNVLPLKERPETVYVLAGSDAERHVERFYPAKKAKRVTWSLRPRTIKGFLEGLPLLFQRQQSEGMDRTFHFSFTGDEAAQATVAIRDRSLSVEAGLSGSPDLHITVDSRSWLSFLAKETNVVRMLLGRKIRIKGNPGSLKDFKRCFPA